MSIIQFRADWCRARQKQLHAWRTLFASPVRQFAPIAGQESLFAVVRWAERTARPRRVRSAHLQDLLFAGASLTGWVCSGCFVPTSWAGTCTAGREPLFAVVGCAARTTARSILRKTVRAAHPAQGPRYSQAQAVEFCSAHCGRVSRAAGAAAGGRQSLWGMYSHTSAWM